MYRPTSVCLAQPDVTYFSHVQALPKQLNILTGVHLFRTKHLNKEAVRLSCNNTNGLKLHFS